MLSISIGIAAAIGLYMLYQAAEHRWPDNYFSVGPSVDPLVSRKLGRYALFRLGPVFLAGAFAAVTANRLHNPVPVALLTLGAVHLANTSLLALARILRRSDRRRRLTAAAFHAILVIAVSGTLWISGITAFLLRPLIPHPSELSIALWAGLFAAVLGVWVQRLTFRSSALPSLLGKLRVEVTEDLLDYARAQAAAHSADPQLIEAILLSEALNRPPWMRSLEMKKGRLLRRGSYGIMQVYSPRPISDKESINQVAKQYSGIRVQRDQYGDARPLALHSLVEKHNPDSKFVELVDQIFRLLEPSSSRATRARAGDGLPVIQVAEIVRRGESIVLTGSALPAGDLHYLIQHETGVPGMLQTLSLQAAGSGGRVHFHLSVPVSAYAVSLQDSMMSEPDRQVTVPCGFVDQEYSA